jgi:hypothetical protein
MKVLENGDYQLDDGSIVPADKIGKLFEKEPKKKPEKDQLEEGQCSGPIQLHD